MPFTTKQVGNKDFYDYYVERAVLKKRPYVERKVFGNVLQDFNKLLLDKIIFNAEKVKLPYRLGTIYVRKFRHNYHECNKRLWNIDFKATKEQGVTVYHADEFGYGFKWVKKGAKVSGIRYHRFRASRKANRLIAHAIKNKHLDFFE